MKRKTFLKASAIAAPVILGMYAAFRYRNSFIHRAIAQADFSKRKLVLIELQGGNDGLNTVIPIDKYNILSQCRGDILIPESKILKLNDTNAWGFHPSMSGLRQLYNDKLLSVVHGVGSPVPEFSHFQARATRYSANAIHGEIRSGWAGRYLLERYPGFPTGYPVHSSDGPPALRIGAVSPRITQFVSSETHSEEDISIGISSFDKLNPDDELPVSDMMGNSLAENNMDKIRAVARQLQLYSPVIREFAGRQQSLSKRYPAPGTNVLADQLKMVAQLIGAGLNTPVYIVSQPEYDTHANQVDRSDTTKGAHATLLGQLSEAITAFEDDLHLMNKQDEVLGMTFSEFGRRIQSGSYGTDHGTAETVLMFGAQLKKRMWGSSPELPSKITFEDNLAMQHDFRTLYKNVLRDWMGVSDERVRSIINQGPEAALNLFRS